MEFIAGNTVGNFILSLHQLLTALVRRYGLLFVRCFQHLLRNDISAWLWHHRSVY